MILCVVGEQSQVVETDHNQAWLHYIYITGVRFDTLIIKSVCCYYFEDKSIEKYILSHSVAVNTQYDELAVSLL